MDRKEAELEPQLSGSRPIGPREKVVGQKAGWDLGTCDWCAPPEQVFTSLELCHAWQAGVCIRVSGWKGAVLSSFQLFQMEQQW